MNCESKQGEFCFPIDLCSVCASGNRLRFDRDRVSAEHLLHRDPGVGSVLPAAVFPARAALGQLQTQLEHRELRGGHRPQEQKPLARRQHHQPHQPHLAGHRILGVSIECVGAVVLRLCVRDGRSVPILITLMSPAGGTSSASLQGSTRSAV